MNAIKPSKKGSKPLLKLAYGEDVVAIVPEYARGPGWSNSVLWVHIRTSDGRLRTEALQPEERSRDQQVLFATLAAAHEAMLATLEVVKSKASKVQSLSTKRSGKAAKQPTKRSAKTEQ